MHGITDDDIAGSSSVQRRRPVAAARLPRGRDAHQPCLRSRLSPTLATAPSRAA